MTIYVEMITYHLLLVTICRNCQFVHHPSNYLYNPTCIFGVAFIEVLTSLGNFISAAHWCVIVFMRQYQLDGEIFM